MRLAQYLAAAALAVLAGCETSTNRIIGIGTSGGGGATQLTFVVPPPANTAHAGATISPAIQVAAQDASGNADTTYTNTVVMAIGTNPAAGTLGGTTVVVPIRGVATFSNLMISPAGAGYTLTATSGTLTGATSAAFTIAP
jgi:hypothetical protein